jgi:hypothetical protein
MFGQVIHVTITSGRSHEHRSVRTYPAGLRITQTHVSPSVTERLRDLVEGVAAVVIITPLRPSCQKGFEAAGRVSLGRIAPGFGQVSSVSAHSGKR